MRKHVYNLEFPSWCSEITVYGYRFTRLEQYRDRVTRLQHLGGSHGEFQILANTGEHAVTAYVDIPDSEEVAILEWENESSTALSDIILLLSIFTQRDVFVVDVGSAETEKQVITADPRFYQGGGILRCSIPFQGHPAAEEPYRYDIGFQKGLNQIYDLIRSDEWQRKYRRGYFLFMARMAFRRQPLEAAFIQCWTIWEHLFGVLNQSWLSRRQIRSLSASEKISYLLVNYAIRDRITEAEHQRINALATIRNRLVHFGRFPDQDPVHSDALLFVRLTEFIVARTLNLSPSNVLNTLERLEDFLNNVAPRRPA
jgi:hypothetical protein